VRVMLLLIRPHTMTYVVVSHTTAYCIHALILRHMCLVLQLTAYVRPHTAIYVSSYCYICVLILLQACLICVSYYSLLHMRVLILLYMCPHTAIYVSHMCLVLQLTAHVSSYESSYCCICVLILLYKCPHTAI
jgi:hypothetical protein